MGHMAGDYEFQMTIKEVVVTGIIKVFFSIHCLMLIGTG
jgi:tetrahydromethanopterin S-methyltransferase subunit C